MEWLNYNHLYYFWIVAKEGSITAACRKLGLSQPTVSAQIQSLENALECELFNRRGRRLILSDAGRMAFHRAGEIFSLGRDFLDALKGRAVEMPRVRLNVGVTDTLPKLLAYRLIEPATSFPNPVSLICHEGKHADLLARLSIYELDLVITTEPIGSQARVRAYNHFLGECGMSVFCTPSKTHLYSRHFPKSLKGAPFLLPTANTSLRRLLNNWFAQNDLQPSIAGEFDDSALIKIFGQAGLGLFLMPTVEEGEVLQQYKVKVIGRLSEIREKYYVISAERKLKNPAVLAITESAHRALFEESKRVESAPTAARHIRVPLENV
jgi:LysR family transcriptional activator of nhaA